MGRGACNTRGDLIQIWHGTNDQVHLATRTDLLQYYRVAAGAIAAIGASVISNQRGITDKLSVENSVPVSRLEFCGWN